MPKSPEQWLEEVSTPEKKRGILKLFLGYAPGVGKTYSMLSEAQRRRSRGEDVVIGVVEIRGRKGIADLASQLEAVPLRKIEYKGAVFEEMDVDAIIARRPQVALVDELAHTNIPGSKHRKRYEDVLDLLDANIDVISTINVQHLESLAPTVQAITGITVRETVPDWVLQLSSEPVMVDLTPEALLNRIRRGDVYTADKIDQALKNFFRRGNLIALRELALQQVADEVDRSLESYRTAKKIEENWGVRERIAVFISTKPSAQYLIARAARRARRMDADLYAVHIMLPSGGVEQSSKSLEASIQFAQNLGAEIVRLRARSVAEGAAQFVRERHITHVVIGRSSATGWRNFLYLLFLHRFLRAAPLVDVQIVVHEEE
jgi:two-component system, OmpR family, sensor histidine kinase KdpD